MTKVIMVVLTAQHISNIYQFYSFTHQFNIAVPFFREFSAYGWNNS